MCQLASMRIVRIKPGSPDGGAVLDFNAEIAPWQTALAGDDLAAIAASVGTGDTATATVMCLHMVDDLRPALSCR